MSTLAGVSVASSSAASSLGSPPAECTFDIPPAVHALVEQANSRLPIETDDPLLIVEVNEEAVAARQQAFPAINVTKPAIAAIITPHLAMEPDLNGGPSNLIYRDTYRQYQRAINDLLDVPWLRRTAGLPDLGKVWVAVSIDEVVAMNGPFSIF